MSKNVPFLPVAAHLCIPLSLIYFTYSFFACLLRIPISTVADTTSGLIKTKIKWRLLQTDIIKVLLCLLYWGPSVSKQNYLFWALPLNTNLSINFDTFLIGVGDMNAGKRGDCDAKFVDTDNILKSFTKV